MITAIVHFKLPAEIDAKKAAELFKGSAPKYRGMKGLVRKYYLFDDEKRIGGGVYLAPGSIAHKDALTTIFGNHASTSDDDVFGTFLP